MYDKVTWWTRVIPCYFLGQSTVVASHTVLHSLHQSPPCRLTEPLYLGKEEETKRRRIEEEEEVLLLSTSMQDMTVAMLHVLWIL